MKAKRLLLGVALTLLASPAYTSTTSLPVSGYITDASNDPIDTDTEMTFKLYATCDDTSAIATSTQTVSFDAGTFNTTIDLDELESSELIAVNAATSLCLGITVGSDSEMTPRSEYHTVPYARQALTASAASTADVCTDLSSAGYSTVSTSLAGTGLSASGGTLNLSTASNFTWSGTNSYSGQAAFTKNPGGTGTADTSSASATLLVNVASPDANEVLLSVRKDSSTDLFLVDEDGDATITGTVTLGSYTNGGAGCGALSTNASGVITCGSSGSGITGVTADSGGATTGSAVTLAGGTNGIDTVRSTDTLTLNLDTTEIGTSTFGTGSAINWTFNASGGTDPLLAFASGLVGVKDAADTAAVAIAFYDNDSTNYVAIKAPATVASDVTLTLPIDDGTAGQVLTTDGSGVLSWASGVGSAVTSAEITDGEIVNADINATAAIAYSKLDLTGSVVTGDITDNTITASDLAATLTFADSDLINLAAINGSSTTEGLILPQASNVSTATAEGQISWDSDDDILYVGDGSDVKAMARLFSDVMFARTTFNTLLTDNGDAVQTVALTLGDDADGDLVSGIKITATSANTGDADFLVGLNIDDMTGDAAVTEVGMNVGSGWDVGILAASPLHLDNSGGLSTAPIVFEDSNNSITLQMADATATRTITIPDASGTIALEPTITNVIASPYAIQFNYTANTGVFTNAGAGGAVLFTLPPAVAGMQYTFVVAAAQNLDVNPDDNDQILVDTDAVGDAIRSSTLGETVTLLAIDATNWVITGQKGTWTDVD